LNLKSIIKIDKDIDTIEQCIGNIGKCSMHSLRLIYEIANFAVDFIDDLCDYRMVNIQVGYGLFGAGFGPTNCDLISYGLGAPALVLHVSGAALAAVGALVTPTVVGAPIGAGLIGLGAVV